MCLPGWGGGLAGRIGAVEVLLESNPYRLPSSEDSSTNILVLGRLRV